MMADDDDDDDEKRRGRARARTGEMSCKPSDSVRRGSPIAAQGEAQ